MPAPTFNDLGKSAKDIFSKGYNFGLFKLEVKTKTQNGINFTANGESNQDTGKVSGSLETKYKLQDYGLTLVEKWNTDNNLNTEITLEDQIAQGLKLTFEAAFSPQTGKKNGRVKTAYQHENFHLNGDVDLDYAGPKLHGASVLHYNGWLAGCQLSFDTSKNQLMKNNFSLGYTTGDLVLHTHVNDGNDFGGSVYQRLNDKLESAVMLSWSSGNNATRFALASKYTIDKDTSFRAKVNNTSQVGLGYTQTVRDGVELTLSALIDCKNLNQGGHKVGLGLKFEA